VLLDFMRLYPEDDGRAMKLKIKVINKKDNNFYPGQIYVGRGSVLGNKFIIGKDGNRAEVIQKYEIWLRKSISLKKKKVYNFMFSLLKKARKKDRILYLECFCKPLPCHGDIIKTILLEMDKEMGE
jgi:hypothetical protein